MFDLEEQERIDALKDWWKQYGVMVILAVVVLAATVIGVQGWRHYKGQQAEQAAQQYITLQKAIADKDEKKIREETAVLIDKFSATPYAGRAALAAASMNHEAGDLKSARTQLEWVLNNAKEDGIRDVARLRLAGILIDEKNFDAAHKLLDTKHGESFDGLYLDMKGDLLAAQGKTAEAKAAYKSAVEKLEQRSPYRGLIQMKLDALGGTA